MTPSDPRWPAEWRARLEPPVPGRWCRRRRRRYRWRRRRRRRRWRCPGRADLELSTLCLELLPAGPCHHHTPGDGDQEEQVGDAEEGEHDAEVQEEGEHEHDAGDAARDEHEAALRARQVRAGRHLGQEHDGQHRDRGQDGQEADAIPVADDPADDHCGGPIHGQLFVGRETAEVHVPPLAATRVRTRTDETGRGRAGREGSTRIAPCLDGRWGRRTRRHTHERAAEGVVEMGENRTPRPEPSRRGLPTGVSGLLAFRVAGPRPTGCSTGYPVCLCEPL